MEIVIFFGIGITFVLLMLYYSYVQAQKRREAWQKVAHRLSFQYHEEDATEERFSTFKIFSQGRRRGSCNILVGKNEQDEMRTLDYQYTTGSGKSSHTHHQTLCIVQSKAVNVPHFFVRKENSFFDFLGKLFGGQDINFDVDPKFSKAFVLQGENEPAVRSLFNGDLRRVFLSFEGTNMQIEGRGDTLIFNPCEPVEPEKVGTLISNAIKVRKALSHQREP